MAPPLDSPLRRWRIEAGLTQEEAGEKLGLSNGQATVSKWERGDRCAVRAADLSGLAQLYGKDRGEITEAFRKVARFRRQRWMIYAIAAPQSFWLRLEKAAQEGGSEPSELLVEWATDNLNLLDGERGQDEYERDVRRQRATERAKACSPS